MQKLGKFWSQKLDYQEQIVNCVVKRVCTSLLRSLPICSFDCDQVMKLQNMDYYSKYSNVTRIPPYLYRLQKSHPVPWTTMGPYFRENMYGSEWRKTNHVLIHSNCSLNHTCDANLKKNKKST